jgi:hypothetical protein
VAQVLSDGARATLAAMTTEDENTLMPLRAIFVVIIMVIGVAAGMLLAAWFGPV